MAYTLRTSAHKMLTMQPNDPGYFNMLLTRQVLTHVRQLSAAIYPHAHAVLL